MSKQFKNPNAALIPLLFDGLQEFIEHVPNWSNQKIAVELGKTLATQQDGHTELDLMQSAVGFNRLPISFYFFDQKLYIINANLPYQHLLGKQVVAIDGMAIKQVYESLLPIMPADNVMETWHMAPIYMLAPRLLQELGVTTAENKVRLAFASGEEVVIEGLTISDYQKQTWKNVRAEKDLAPPLYLKERSKPYWYTYLPEAKTFYFQYNQVRNQKGSMSIAKFSKRMLAEIDRLRPNKLVIDMRLNRGGELQSIQAID